MRETLLEANRQFYEFRKIISERNRKVRKMDSELKAGLAEVFQALNKIAAGDPTVRIPETSGIELISQLKHVVNVTAENIGEIVEQSHEFAISLAEYFDVLHRFSTGDMEARVEGFSEVELLDSLKNVLNETIGSISKEMAERKRAESEMRSTLSLLNATLESTTDGILVVDSSGRIRTFNRKFLQLWRIPPEVIEKLQDEEALSFVCSQLKDPASFIRKVRELYEHPHEKSFDTLEFLDGRVYERYSQSQEIEGNIAGRVWSFRDITERVRAEESFREMEALESSILSAIPHPVIGLHERQIVFANEAVETVFGWKPREIIGKPSRILYRNDEEFEEIGRRFYPVLKKQRTHTEEFYCRHKSGRDIVCRVSASVRGENLREKKIVVIYEDITEQKKVQEIVQLDEARMEALLKLNQMTDSSFQEIVNFALEEGTRLTSSKIGYIAFLNEDETILTMNAWSKTAMTECRISEKPLVYPVEKTGLWGEAVRQRRPVVVNDYAAPHPLKKGYPEGHVTLIRHMNVPIFDGERIVAVAGVGNKQSDYNDSDIRQLTLLMVGMWRLYQRKLSRESLKASEEKYRYLFDAEPDAIILIDAATHQHREANESALRLYGYTRDEFLSLKWSDISVPTEEIAEELLTGEQGMVMKLPLRYHLKKDGSIFPVEISAVFFEHQNRKMLFVAIRDITERKALEAQLMQAQKMEAVGTLAGGVAHDFNNILTAIISYLNIALMKIEKGNPIRTYINRVLESAEKAATLVQSLLAFSRKQIITPEAIDLNRVIYKLRNLLQRLIGEDIELNLTLGDGALIVMADSGQIEHVLMNLATNARDAIPDIGSLVIGTGIFTMDGNFIKTHGYGKAGRYAMITVTDTGEGMEEKTRERIFEPFFTTKEVGKGTGLGLAMVYGIIKQHEGYISCYSEPGKGSTFRIYLPLIESKTRDVPESAVPSIPTGTETILLAEDNTDVRMAAREILTDGGYRVIEAVDGEDAVLKFTKSAEEISLLILDVIMPRKNGKEVYDTIRQMRPDIKVLFSSGYPADIINKKGILEQRMHFILKPFSTHVFLQKVREILDEGASQQ